MRTNRLLGMIAILVFSLLAFPFTASAAEGQKIGILDVKRCMSDSKKGSRLSQEFKGKVDELDKKAGKLEEEAKKISQDVERQQALMTDAVKEEKKKRFLQIRDEVRELGKARQKIADQLSEAILGDLQEAINKFANENGYDLILTSGGPWLAFAKQSMDITDSVIKIYDAIDGTKK